LSRSQGSGANRAPPAVRTLGIPGMTVDGIECHRENYPLFNIGVGDRYWIPSNQPGITQ